MPGAYMPAAITDRALEVLQTWARGLIARDRQFDRAYVFGSLVYKGGQQFMPKSSDVDLLLRFAPDVASPVKSVRACESLLKSKRQLEEQLADILGSPAGQQRVSAVVVSSFESEHGIHKDGLPTFFSASEFLNLEEPSPTPSPLAHHDGTEVTFRPTYSYSLPVIQLAQRCRNRFLTVGSVGPLESGLAIHDGPDVVPKEIMRAAAQLRYFAKELRDRSAFDLNLG